MERPLTVVSIATARSWRGGEGQVLALHRGLAARGHRAIVAARPGSPLAQRAVDAGIETAALRIGSPLHPLSIRRVARILKDAGADVVHMHDSHAHTVGVLGSRFARVARRVVSRRVPFRRSGLGRLKYRYGIDRYLAVSGAVRDVLLEEGVATERVAVVHDGVDPARFAGGDGDRIRRELGVPADAPLIGSVACLTRQKSLETLIRAAGAILADAPSAYFLLVGEGGHRPVLASERDRSPFKDRILMPGFRDDIVDVLAAFDVFVMPSLEEGLCSSVLEAFAARVPVAAARSGGIPELVEHGRTGLLFEPGQAAELAAGVILLLRDRDLARRVRDDAQAELCSRFTHDAMVEGTLRAYREVLDVGDGAR